MLDIKRAECCRIPSTPTPDFSKVQFNEGGGAFHEAMHMLGAGRTFDRKLASVALQEVLRSSSTDRDARLSALLVGSAAIASSDMVVGFVDAISDLEDRDIVHDKPSLNLGENDRVVGCAGSGKKGRKTFNISTASMLVASAGGSKVVKTGSHSTSSLTGSTDILESFGFITPKTMDESSQLLFDTNFGFYSIEDMVPRFDSMYGQRFFAPHALSYVLSGVLIPVKTDTLLYGYAGPRAERSVRSFLKLGYQTAMVCSNTQDGIHYIDEMATTGTTIVVGAVNGECGSRKEFDAGKYVGAEHQAMPDIDAASSKNMQRQRFIDVIAGRVPESIAENTVCLNAATIMYLAKKCDTPIEGYGMAKEIVRSGASLTKLKEVISASQKMVHRK